MIGPLWKNIGKDYKTSEQKVLSLAFYAPLAELKEIYEMLERT